MRKTLHTSETYVTRKQLEEAVALLTRDGTTFSNTYIPADEIMQAVELIQEAADLLTETLHENDSSKKESDTITSVD